MDKSTVIGWAFLRVTFGLVLSLIFGLQKLTSGAAEFTVQVAAMGFPLPAFFAWCSILAEFVGGLLFSAGLFTRITSALIAVNMTVAVYSMREGPALMMLPAIQFLLIMIAGVIAGGGSMSLDARWPGLRWNAFPIPKRGPS